MNRKELEKLAGAVLPLAKRLSNSLASCSCSSNATKQKCIPLMSFTANWYSWCAVSIWSLHACCRLAFVTSLFRVPPAPSPAICHERWRKSATLQARQIHELQAQVQEILTVLVLCSIAIWEIDHLLRSLDFTFHELGFTAKMQARFVQETKENLKEGKYLVIEEWFFCSVSYLHHMNGHRSPASTNQGVECSMPAAHLMSKRQPITNEMLGQMLSELDRDHKPSHDRLVLKAPIMLGFFGLLRVSEFTITIHFYHTICHERWQNSATLQARQNPWDASTGSVNSNSSCTVQHSHLRNRWSFVISWLHFSRTRSTSSGRGALLWHHVKCSLILWQSISDTALLFLCNNIQRGVLLQTHCSSGMIEFCVEQQTNNFLKSLQSRGLHLPWAVPRSLDKPGLHFCCKVMYCQLFQHGIHTKWGIIADPLNKGILMINFEATWSLPCESEGWNRGIVGIMGSQLACVKVVNRAAFKSDSHTLMHVRTLCKWNCIPLATFRACGVFIWVVLYRSSFNCALVSTCACSVQGMYRNGLLYIVSHRTFYVMGGHCVLCTCIVH